MDVFYQLLTSGSSLYPTFLCSSYQLTHAHLKSGKFQKMADRIQCRSRRSTESLSAIIEDSISKTLQANEDIDNNEKQRIFDRFKEVIML